VAVFELSGALAPAIPELAVGPWRSAPGLVAFDAAGPPESVWRVDLARDPAASRAALAGAERSVASTHAALDDLPLRFDRALAALDAARPDPARNVHGGPALSRVAASPIDPRLVMAPELSPAEARLVAALVSSEAASAQRSRPPGASLASSPESPPAWTASPAGPDAPPELDRPGWLDALDRIADLVRGRARIETRIEGALVARSVMTLSGDTDVWTAPRLSLAGAQLHARSVAVAVRTRHAWARILTLVVRSGSQILALGLPAAAMAALPLVWRFVRDVLREAGDRTAAAGTAV
jgi:hypothetical protein